jgi:hypothetical protein
MGGKEEGRILPECYREDKKNADEKEREKYHRRNGYANEEVERMRAEERMMRARGTKTRTSKREEIESENPVTTGSMRV